MPYASLGYFNVAIVNQIKNLLKPETRCCFALIWDMILGCQKGDMLNF